MENKITNQQIDVTQIKDIKSYLIENKLTQVQYYQFIEHRLKQLNYESRLNQLKMLYTIITNLANDKHIIIEAPTGTGKTFAYLLGAVYTKFTKNLSYITVSTKTKILQDQLFDKDVQLINKILGFETNTIRLFGSNEYLCPLKYKYIIDNNNVSIDYKGRLQACELTKDIYAKFSDDEIKKMDFSLLTREPETCKGKKCSFINVCPYYNVLKTIKKADILIINHYLFFTDILVDHKLLKLGDNNIIIFDEAHALEDIAIDFFGEEISYFGIMKLLGTIYNPKYPSKGLKYRLHSLATETNKSFLTDLKDLSIDYEYIYKLLIEYNYISEDSVEYNELLNFFTESDFGNVLSKIEHARNDIIDNLLDFMIDTFNIEHKRYSQARNVLFENVNIFLDFLFPKFARLILLILNAYYLTNDSDNLEEIEIVIKKLNGFINKLYIFQEIIKNIQINSTEQYKYLLWLETNENEYTIKNINIKLSYLEINKIFREKILNAFKATVYISATLAVNNDFTYFRNIIGLEENFVEQKMDSDFDLLNQQYVFIPQDFSLNKITDKEYLNMMMPYITDLIGKLNGRTLILTTSYFALNYVYNTIKRNSYNINIKKQGELDRNTLLEMKRKEKDMVLIGTSSLWEGIDIQGDALQCVIILKLPFDVPSNPLIKARSEYFKINGLNPFMSFLLPRAVIRFKQGVGRLIRNKTDKGIIAVLDNRLHTKGYASFFTRELYGQYVTNINDIPDFNTNKDTGKEINNNVFDSPIDDEDIPF